ncbi:hypothetical protein AB1Y20_001480 [Prymnesium parvum]|uniref:Uncharacterized protein n=1 Tax=Prymnesium parvum TaxID=97485 RepID=A0AB34K8C0_PRYPA
MVEEEAQQEAWWLKQDSPSEELEAQQGLALVAFSTSCSSSGESSSSESFSSEATSSSLSSEAEKLASESDSSSSAYDLRFPA